MSGLVLEMRIRVPVTLEDVAERKAELRERVRDLDERPAFFTAEEWLFRDADTAPEPFTTHNGAKPRPLSWGRGRGPDG